MSEETLEILLVEDNKSDAWLLERTFADIAGQHCRTTRVDCLEHAIHHLAVHRYDAVMLDLFLPDSQGIDTFEAVRTNAPDAAIVVLTGLNDEHVATRAVHEGAQDYLVKGHVNTDAVRRALRYAVERKRTEARLRAYAAELQRSNQDLENFASRVSHDLKDPLNTAQLLAAAAIKLSHGHLPPEAEDFLHRQVEVLHRMSAMVRDVLEYSQVTRDRSPFERVDLSEIIEKILSDLQSRIEESGGQITLGNLPTITANRVQMHQLFQNLIHNALKFCKKSEPPQVQISGRRMERTELDAERQDGTWWEIQVIDNGIGFDMKDLGLIFGMFERLHDRSEYEGFGIGLSLCKRVVDQHGGIITATSTPGVGSTFIVRLPEHPNASTCR